MRIRKNKFYLTSSGDIAWVSDVHRLFKFVPLANGQIGTVPIPGPLGLDVITIQAGPMADRCIHMYDGNGNCRDTLWKGHKLIKEINP